MLLEQNFAHFLKLLGVKHRTLTHWLITPLLIAAIGVFNGNDYVSLILFSIALGMLTHDIGDMLTNRGIRGFFFPLFPNMNVLLLPRILVFETFSVAEMIVNLFLFLSILVQGYFIYAAQIG